EPDRMVQRRLDHGKAEPGVMHRGGERAGEADRIGIDRDAVEMMLGEPDNVGSELVGQERLAHRFVDDLAVARRIAAVGKQKVAEFHAYPCKSAAYAFPGKACAGI